MKLLVCGDRKWTDRDTLYRILDNIHFFHKIEVLIEGEAKGADQMARDWARSRKVFCRPFHALWSIYKRGAGPIRNKQMLDEGQPDRVAAFHNNIRESIGTAHMIKIATDAGVPTQIYKSPKIK